MEKFVITGKSKLTGSVRVSGNKNEALPVLAACLLTKEPIILKNVPRIGDVEMMLDILQSQGVKITSPDGDKHTLKIQCDQVENAELDTAKCALLRASLLLAGPLISRFNRVVLPPPGGDVIGRRRLDTHFLAFRKLGATVSVEDKKYVIEKQQLAGLDIFLDEQSVTATENAIMAAVQAKGRTVIRNAACEPHVSGLATMLNDMGAKISGIGTNILTIDGVESLHGCEHTIGPDYLEIGGYIVLGAITGKGITIESVNPRDLDVIHSMFHRLGISYEIGEDSMYVPGWQEQKLAIEPDFAGEIPKIDDGPWPAFPSDLMSIVIVAATMVEGTVLVFEKMYDGRMFFVDYLISMGARIVLCDPHRAVVVGPSTLYGTRLTSPDIRAGMALIIAALCAEGESHIYNIRQIDRGYEDLEGKLRGLGAIINRVDE